MSDPPDWATGNKPADGGSQHMFKEDHDCWLTALKTNDVDTVRQMLEEADKEEREVLLEGWINTDVFWTDVDGGVTDKEAFGLRRAFPLAAVCGSLDVLQELVERGINACQTDHLGNNAVHSIIIYSSLLHNFEQIHVKVYQHFRSILHDDVIEEMILAENSDGLRPVELAAHYQTLRILEAIYNTPGHYVQKSHTCGMMTTIHYEIDEYEGIAATRPLHMSPMVFLVHLGHKKLDDDYTRYFFTRSLFANWISSRRKSFAVLVVIWFLIRLFVISMAFLSTGLTSPTVTTSSLCGYDPGLSDRSRMACTILLLVVAVMGLIFDVWDVAHMGRVFPEFRKRYVVHQGYRFVRYWNYRLAQALFNLSAVVLCINKICGYYGGSSMPIYWTAVFIVILTICSIWSLLFFGQLIESLGNYITATQRMMNDLFRFGVLFMVFILPFTITFGNFMLPDDNGTCPDEFTGVASSLYSGFEISQNIQDLREYSSPSKEGLWLAHVAYVTLIVILMLNFLISIFNDSYAAVAANPDIIFELQWLSVLVTIDGRVPTCLRPLLHKIKRRHFAVEGRLGKLAVKTFETKKLQEWIYRWSNWNNYSNIVPNMDACFGIQSMSFFKPGAYCLPHWDWDKMAAILTDDIFLCIFFKENVWILNKISWEYVP